MVNPTPDTTISYAGYRFPPKVISYAEWLYFRFPLSLRMVEELLAARDTEVTYETMRQWELKVGQQVAKRIRAAAAPLATSGISMKWSLSSKANCTGYGGP